ncbi:hypothetical protein C8Q70DRAFT_671737 [Cubamyces menziesii]|nr:hypothetical protein C8Q70DRAFT_671737 [Cubamyces menziesii]
MISAHEPMIQRRRRCVKPNATLAMQQALEPSLLRLLSRNSSPTYACRMLHAHLRSLASACSGTAWTTARLRAYCIHCSGRQHLRTSRVRMTTHRSKSNQVEPRGAIYSDDAGDARAQHACRVGIREIIQAVGQQKWLILSSCWKFGTSELHICFCELQPCLRRSWRTVGLVSSRIYLALQAVLKPSPSSAVLLLWVILRTRPCSSAQKQCIERVSSEPAHINVLQILRPMPVPQPSNAPRAELSEIAAHLRHA